MAAVMDKPQTTMRGLNAPRQLPLENGDHLRLDADNEVQLDALLRIDAAYGGQSLVATDGFIEGAPELMVEIAGSGAAGRADTRARRLYQRASAQKRSYNPVLNLPCRKRLDIYGSLYRPDL